MYCLSRLKPGGVNPHIQIKWVIFLRVTAPNNRKPDHPVGIFNMETMDSEQDSESLSASSNCFLVLVVLGTMGIQ